MADVSTTVKITRYKRIIDGLVGQLTPVIETQALLQKERRQLVSRKYNKEKRADWNRRAAEWRTKKMRTLQIVATKHTPAYGSMIHFLLTLDPAEMLSFDKEFTAVEREYDKLNNKLRKLALNDLS